MAADKFHTEEPAFFADGTRPQPKVESEDVTQPAAKLADGTAPAAPAFRASPELVARATAIGETWSQEYVRSLKAQQRDIVGGWPGTLREARRRILAAMPRDIDPLMLDELARITNLGARKLWETVSEPDLEP
jgi:hypothetical protein